MCVYHTRSRRALLKDLLASSCSSESTRDLGGLLWSQKGDSLRYVEFTWSSDPAQFWAPWQVRALGCQLSWTSNHQLRQPELWPLSWVYDVLHTYAALNTLVTEAKSGVYMLKIWFACWSSGGRLFIVHSRPSPFSMVFIYFH